MASKCVAVTVVLFSVFLVGLVPSKVSAQAGDEATTNSTKKYSSIAIVGGLYCKCWFSNYDYQKNGTPESSKSASLTLLELITLK